MVRLRTFDKRADASVLTLSLEGFFRPVIGAAFAGLSLAILASGLFAPAPGPEQVLAVVVTIAFVAGFSERFDQTLTAKTETELAGSAHAT